MHSLILLRAHIGVVLVHRERAASLSDLWLCFCWDRESEVSGI